MSKLVSKRVLLQSVNFLLKIIHFHTGEVLTFLILALNALNLPQGVVHSIVVPIFLVSFFNYRLNLADIIIFIQKVSVTVSET